MVKQFWTDRGALSFAAMGIILMAFTLAWRINPVEQSVVPRFLFDTPLGLAMFWVLFVTCMPAWILALLSGGLLMGDRGLSWLPGWFSLFNLWAISLQGILCFLVGKGASVCIRKFRR
jgi:hypothetical protein